MDSTSVWTPTLGSQHEGLYTSVWIPTLGSREAHSCAWLSFVLHVQVGWNLHCGCSLIAVFLVWDFQDWIHIWEMCANMDACVHWKLCALIAFIVWCFHHSSAVALEVANLKQPTLTWFLMKML